MTSRDAFRILRPWWVPLVIILVITAVAYRGVLANQFVLDDTHTVVRNPAVRSFANAGDWFSSPHAASGTREYVNYRPILVASYAVDHALWGGSPAGSHATNLAIHLVVVALVFLLGRRLAREPWMSACAAALFALHPINAEAVNYVTARSSSLMALGALGAIWAVTRADEGFARAWRFAAYVLGGVALGAKETAVVLPLLVIAWRRAVYGSHERWSVTIRRSVPWWMLVAGFLALRTWILWGLAEPALTGPGVTVGQNALFAAKIYAASLGHWVWPSGLAVDHAWPLWVTGRDAVVIVGALAAALAATAAVMRRDGVLGWCAVWFWIAIIPVGALGFVTRLALYQDNRVYLAGVGLAWLGGQVAAVSLRWGAARPAMRVATALAVILVIAAAVKADAARTAVWADRASLWDDVLAKYPASLMAHNGKGMEAFEAGRFQEATEWFDRAVRISPGFAEGHKNLGVTFARIGDWDRAIAALEFALSMDPGYAEARVNLGKVYEHLRRPDLALEAYDRVLRDDPGHTVLLARTAWLLVQAGRPADAVERYRRVLATGRADPESVMDYGVLLLSLERWGEAEQVFSELTAREPTSYAARFNLGTALEGGGDWDRAVDAYRRAAALSATDPDPVFRIGVLFSKQERWKEATAAYDEALTRRPGHAPTHMNLGILAERLGDLPRAIDHYEAVLRTPVSGPGDEALQARARDAVGQLRSRGSGMGG